jgi:Zn-dependent protease
MLPQWAFLVLAGVPSIVLHEVAHGWVADKFGDPTARNAGRLTLNPIAHIDPIGTIAMPVLLALAHFPAIGYAKPVPVNVNRLRKPRNQSVYVSLAGPLTNVIISALAWIGCRIWIAEVPAVRLILQTPQFFLFLLYLGLVNLVLACFNMLPIPPFDGSAVVERLVPRKHLGRYFEIRNQMLYPALIIVVILYATGVGNRVIDDLQTWWLNTL